MVKIEILTPYPVDGKTTKFAVPGETITWTFTTWKHADAPDRLAGVSFMIPAKPSDDGWPDPKRDFTAPKYTVDEKEISQYEAFMFTGTHKITVEITLKAVSYTHLTLPTTPYV